MGKPNKFTRYIIHPGGVRSQADGQNHYIGVAELIRLYQLPSYAYTVVEDTTYRELEGDVHCRPRLNGNYPCFGGPMVE